MYSDKRILFMRMTSLITALNNLNFCDDFENRKLLDNLLEQSRNMRFPLPSGCVGNVLALALELHMFKGAIHIILNSDKFGIDLENCSKSERFGIPYNAKLVFEYAIKEEPYLELPDTLEHLNAKNDIETIKKMLV